MSRLKNETGEFFNIWKTFLNKTKYRDKKNLQSFSETLQRLKQNSKFRSSTEVEDALHKWIK